MKKQAFQRGEIRDADDNILQAGAYGKKTAFVNAQNTGILDYLINNLEVLFDGIVSAGLVVYDKDGKPVLPEEIKTALQSYVTATNNKAKEAANSVKSAAQSETNAASSAKSAAQSETNAASSAKSAAQSETNAASSAKSAAQSETNAASSANVSRENADAAIKAKGVAEEKATAAIEAEARAKEYAEAATAITQAQGAVYIDSEGYINILEVTTDENQN